MTEYAGRGNPRRSMELLWGAGSTPSRGPKPGLTVAAIVEAAIEVADTEGLAALSMRKVAEKLGKSAMSLYTYVPGKPELLDLMLDAVLGETPSAYALDGGWGRRSRPRPGTSGTSTSATRGCCRCRARGPSSGPTSWPPTSRSSACSTPWA